MQEVSLFAAFVAGILSFISPCVLPLIPGYVSFVSGVTLDEMRGAGAATALASSATKRRAVIMSLAFVLGFSIVFISLGASATAIGALLMDHLQLLGKIAGVIIILFGLHMTGVLKIGWLYNEKRVQTNKNRRIFGAFSSASPSPSLSPCSTNPQRHSVRGGRQETVGQGYSCWPSILWLVGFMRRHSRSTISGGVRADSEALPTSESSRRADGRRRLLIFTNIHVIAHCSRRTSQHSDARIFYLY